MIFVNRDGVCRPGSSTLRLTNLVALLGGTVSLPPRREPPRPIRGGGSDGKLECPYQATVTTAYMPIMKCEGRLHTNRYLPG